MIASAVIAALAAAALLLALRAARTERRGRRWDHRRTQLLADRRRRDDQAYGDELARARAMMRPSLPARRVPLFSLDDPNPLQASIARARLDPYSRKVWP